MSDIQIIMPENPMSTLTLFDSDKKGLDYFIDYIANTIESGNDDPLKVRAYADKMIYIANGIKERTKEQAKTEAAKYGEQPFNYAGCEMHLTPTYTKYLYDKCNDPEWEEAEQKERSAGNDRKGREGFLQKVKKPFELLDSRTGEVITIYPPIKTQTTGVKVSIK